jgi:probable HAF family extracellular repeat protein
LYSDGLMRDLGCLSDPSQGSESHAFAINNSGQIVGLTQVAAGTYHAFLWDNGVMRDLGTLGGQHSWAQGINDAGQIVGYSLMVPGSYTQHAFLWEDGMMHDLGTLGGDSSSANGINAAGQIVGNAATALDGGHAFLYSGGTMVDLNSLLPPGTGWVLQDARAINDRGQIAGVGSVNGTTRAFVMSPPGLLPLTPPPAPTELAAQMLTAHQIDLSWTDRSGTENGFEIERRTGDAWVTLATLGVNVTQYSDRELSAYAHYQYRVRAINSGGGSDWSNEATVAFGPTVVLSPDSLTFSDQLVGTISGERSVTISNDGNAPLTIQGLNMGGGQPDDFTAADIGGFTLAPGQSGNLKIRFAPRASGSRNAVLTLTTDAEGSPQTLAMAGTGIAPSLTVGISQLGSPRTVSFGNQGIGAASSPQTITLTNTGNAPLTISAISFGGPQMGEFAIASGGGSGVLAPGASRTLALSFTPTATGPRTATLVITSDAPGSRHTIALTGAGVVSSGGSGRTVLPSGAELAVVAIDGTATSTRHAVISVGQRVTFRLMLKYRSGPAVDVSTDGNTHIFANARRGTFSAKNVWTPKPEDAGKTLVFYGRYYSPTTRKPIVDQVVVSVKAVRRRRR